LGAANVCQQRLDIVHQWAVPVGVSDHNPGFATIVDSANELTYRESAKQHPKQPGVGALATGIIFIGAWAWPKLTKTS
jgi:hypothetical protein